MDIAALVISGISLIVAALSFIFSVKSQIIFYECLLFHRKKSYIV